MAKTGGGKVQSFQMEEERVKSNTTNKVHQLYYRKLRKDTFYPSCEHQL